jgi:hypothetical protein
MDQFNSVDVIQAISDYLENVDTDVPGEYMFSMLSHSNSGAVVIYLVVRDGVRDLKITFAPDDLDEFKKTVKSSSGGKWVGKRYIFTSKKARLESPVTKQLRSSVEKTINYVGITVRQGRQRKHKEIPLSKFMQSYVPKPNSKPSHKPKPKPKPTPTKVHPNKVKSLCDTWLLDKSTNPETGRKIQKDKGVYNKLAKLCISSSSASPAKDSPKKRVSANDLCKQWLSDRNTNPATGRTIKTNGPVYNKLAKQCL